MTNPRAILRAFLWVKINESTNRKAVRKKGLTPNKDIVREKRMVRYMAKALKVHSRFRADHKKLLVDHAPMYVAFARAIEEIF